ncbi:hypothetical protein OpiT1DRAFT_00497 [Opitutaceae bacterium TAV1]|nr:hypothetical protein OPIT5_18865 [Opitutaceae bacterium TAV5]EIQ01921.1 hypothetical protein OpiT1DRAFT_00497 [Opitutaceae bacterium TAV1]
MSTENTTPDSGPVQAPVPPAPAVSSEDKTVAIVSYITLIGFIVAIVLHSKNKTQLGAYHLRQMLMFIIASLFVAIPFIGLIWMLVLLVLWVMGLIAAAQGKMTPMPIIGKLAIKFFPNVFQ